MTKEQYKVEWLLKGAGELSEEEKIELIEDLAKELDAEDEIEYGGQFKRKSLSTFDVSVGILLVSSLNTLINIYKLLQERDDSNIGIRQVNNKMIFINEIDQTIIEENNGTVLANVDGDVFYTSPDDMEDEIELKKKLREMREEEDEE
ncbi:MULTISPECIES: hypothetical protein [Haloferacaceae]|uniref:Uncharacterized protein n=2 Tax=Haloferacaceae TaxID=1644056 RepID=A0ABD6DC55_9EURY|nr:MULTISPECIES: hypothetical protein [Halorubraceae]